MEHNRCNGRFRLPVQQPHPRVSLILGTIMCRNCMNYRKAWQPSRCDRLPSRYTQTQPRQCQWKDRAPLRRLTTQILTSRRMTTKLPSSPQSTQPYRASRLRSHTTVEFRPTPRRKPPDRHFDPLPQCGLCRWLAPHHFQVQDQEAVFNHMRTGPTIAGHMRPEWSRP
jgi:hypothetical protein